MRHSCGPIRAWRAVCLPARRLREPFKQLLRLDKGNGEPPSLPTVSFQSMLVLALGLHRRRLKAKEEEEKAMMSWFLLLLLLDSTTYLEKHLPPLGAGRWLALVVGID
ncbi:hypothetical protein LX36DRAFT_153567 [Colletotrichum falcatum]|nr:hypothetical protein LX36DRAFT_153567 [Colletotrichum falcatum]